jgi:uncharacterized integral membrane protein
MTPLIWSIIGIAGSLGLALNTVIVMIAAACNKGKITLDFNRFKELWFEVPVGVVVFGLGMWGAYHVLNLLLK